jgi:hypothetical protein
MNSSETARKLACSRHALNVLRAEGTGPVWRRTPNGRVDYDPASVEAYAAARAQGLTHKAATERVRQTEIDAIRADTKAMDPDLDVSAYLDRHVRAVEEAYRVCATNAEMRRTMIKVAGIHLATNISALGESFERESVAEAAQ